MNPGDTVNEDQQEKFAIEEMAAALAHHVGEAIRAGVGDAVNEAMFELGAADGMEVELPGVLSDPKVGGEFIAEELMVRPEVRQALVAVATSLLQKLKLGEVE